MARLIKNTQKATLGVRISTVMETGAIDRDFKIGDVIEGLRYVVDGGVEVVSGRLTEIKYTMAPRLSFNKKAPADTLANDLTVNSLVLDASAAYESKIVTVPAREIVEFEGETNVVRMIYKPFLVYEMEMKYSDLSVKPASIQIGDVFDNVRIMNLVGSGIGPDITGKFEVTAFAYASQSGKLAVNGIVFRNTDTGEVVVANLNHILALNELFTYELDEEHIADVIANLADGDTLTVTSALDTSDTQILINKKNITLNLENSVTTDGRDTSGIAVEGGSAILTGSGQMINNTAYVAGQTGFGTIMVKQDGELTINGSGISAVAEDPADNGQFGIKVTGNGKLTINDGNFTAGWYCVSGHGTDTNADAEIEINGGTFVSVTDYTVYEPFPGKITINGGSFSGAAGAIAVNNGTLIINGGDFAVLGGGETGDWVNGTGGLTDVAINLNAKYGDVICRITGGTFHATEAGTIMIQTGTAHNVDLQISGGSFTAKPEAEWIVEGFVCTEEADENGLFHVVAA